MSQTSRFFVALGVLLARIGSTHAQTNVPSTGVGSFDSGGFQIRYASAGEGEPVVLLHGWMSEASNWGPGTRAKPIISPPAGYRVIALDLRGHGESAKPHEESKYGVEMAKDVIRLLDHLKIRRAHIVGYSMGAYVAGKVVDLAPNRVASVVYGGSSPILNDRAVKGFGDADAFDSAVESGRLGQYVIDTTPTGRLKPTRELANKIAEKMFANQDVKALAAVGRSLSKLEVDSKRIRSLAVPTILIYGSKESRYVIDRVEEAKKAMPHAEVMVIKGTDHLTTLRSPTFSSTLIAFLKKHSMNGN